MSRQPVVDMELPAYSAYPEPPATAPEHPPQQTAPVAASTPASPSESPAPPPRSKLFLLACPLALLVGAAITASTTYALAKHVQHLIANAAVDSNPQPWKDAARKEVYDPCYLGCSDCSDPSYAWKACEWTTSAKMPVEQGLICDANKIWNWKDRYPEPCLAALGDRMRAEALKNLKQTYRNQLALIILTVLAGIVGGAIIGRYVNRWAEKRDKKAELARANPPPYSEKAPGAGKKRLKLLLAAFVGLFGRKADAYACLQPELVSNQFFISPNDTISGVVHGWLGDCYTYQQCYITCTTVCTSGINGDLVCSESCPSTCYPVTEIAKAPKDYVRDMAPRVEACGFRLVDAAPGVTTVRVANANIERNYFVKISVNGYNVTRSDYTDDMVLCLHDIGGW